MVWLIVRVHHVMLFHILSFHRLIPIIQPIYMYPNLPYANFNQFSNKFAGVAVHYFKVWIVSTCISHICRALARWVHCACRVHVGTCGYYETRRYYETLDVKDILRLVKPDSKYLHL